MLRQVRIEYEDAAYHVMCPGDRLGREASTQYANSTLDVVFIDAAHDYESVSNDIRAWLPKLKPGAVLAGHDSSGMPFANASPTSSQERRLGEIVFGNTARPLSGVTEG